jgi:hypothetical protein
MTPGGAWILAGSTDLDAFRASRIHHRTKYEFLMPLQRLRSREWSAVREQVFALWASWRSIVSDMEEVVRRFPEEAGPAALLGKPPLSLLPLEEQVRLHELATSEFSKRTPDVESCERIRAELEALRRECEELEVGGRAPDRDAWERALDSLLSLYVKVESLPRGIWVP